MIVTKDDGIVFKRVYKRIKNEEALLLVSLNPVYPPYEIKITDVMEVWKFVLKFSDQLIDENAA